MSQEKKHDLDDLLESGEQTEGSFSITMKPVRRKQLRFDYWTGLFVLAGIMFEAITGPLLLYYYQAGNPYGSTVSIVQTVPLGGIILAAHLYMAYAVILLLFVHMFRNYFVGAYRGAWRWAQWMIGLLLFLVVYSIAVIGYILPEYYIGVDAVHITMTLIERSVIGRVFPALAAFLVSALVGNATTLQAWQHFLAMHAILLTGLAFVLIVVHFFLFEKSGIHEEEKTVQNEKPVPVMPVSMLNSIFLASAFIAVVLIVSALFPQGLLQGYGVPAYGLLPFPDWYLMPVYKMMDVAGLGLSTGGVPFLGILVIIAFLVPFLDRYKGSLPLDRPLFTAMGIFVILFLASMTLWGYAQPGLSQTRPLTLMMFGGMVFVSTVSVYAMKYARRDLHE
ncbi:MAG: cytochrome bc complex cytochrome b subunit [Nitrososphaerota archaeon]|nr:cytochrome bc complex cytochrome b subunit [Nitrososphaerota archaeon]MDG6931675.1 cytochrome bc complex cytochrome b subunit [Nitrososphaerota archaeon]MDG6936250.1 cytochrome bc complex cytochrome b subunit [Nitrososphaerota archaeon]MDG6944144.1 cytochrome bc complex cytochrome b subunit [Nitrososphaerota archaeon]